MSLRVQVTENVVDTQGRSMRRAWQSTFMKTILQIPHIYSRVSNVQQTKFCRRICCYFVENLGKKHYLCSTRTGKFGHTYLIYGSVSLFLSSERRKFVQTKKNKHSVLPSYPFGYRRGIWGLFYFVWVSYDLFD